uniref:Lysine--tRNA ligase, chloroplastic/mitochondrial n=1 Tax=Tanacetum cinerariifolium TaxID=118510 RepID=A0A6L2LT26_TANCI|nr:lysine--tRNA ligase, chloroplastic/mitochondrial [Tanacetum cinerariifolium]
MKVEESLNVTFDEIPPTNLSLLVDDDVGEEEAIIKNTKVVNNNIEEDESIEVDEIVNIKESKNHPLYQVIRNLNQRTLREAAASEGKGPKDDDDESYEVNLNENFLTALGYRMPPALGMTLLSELYYKVGFLVTKMCFDALLESLLSTAKLSQSAGYRILAS